MQHAHEAVHLRLQARDHEPQVRAWALAHASRQLLRGTYAIQAPIAIRVVQLKGKAHQLRGIARAHIPHAPHKLWATRASEQPRRRDIACKLQRTREIQATAVVQVCRPRNQRRQHARIGGTAKCAHPVHQTRGVKRRTRPRQKSCGTLSIPRCRMHWRSHHVSSGMCRRASVRARGTHSWSTAVNVSNSRRT